MNCSDGALLCRQTPRRLILLAVVDKRIASPEQIFMFEMRAASPETHCQAIAMLGSVVVHHHSCVLAAQQTGTR